MSRPSPGSSSSEPGKRERRRSWRWPAALLGAAVLLAAYYGIALGSLRSRASSIVPVEEATAGSDGSAEALTLEVEAVDLDTATGALDIRIQPLPEGSFAGDRGGQLSEPVQVEVSSPGGSVTSFDFPADQALDPVTVSLEAETPAYWFPFDRPDATLRLRALSRDSAVPIDLKLLNETEGWRLFGTARTGSELQVEVEARRELLAITFSVIYIVGVVVVALTTLAVIGYAISHRRVQFDQVIWLVAMLAVIPAVRNEMPGVPPIGTAVDLFILLPSVFVIIVALLAAIVVLAKEEAATA